MSQEENNLIAQMLLQLGFAQKLLRDMATGVIHPDDHWNTIEDIICVHTQFDDCLDRLTEQVIPF